MADLKTTNIYGDAYINNKVGIATNAPATRLQIGQLSPTAATEGIQFGDDPGTRVYRSAAGILTYSGSIEISANASLNGNYGNWTGEINKIQWHSNNLYLVNRGGGSWLFRNSSAANVFSIAADGGTSAAANINAGTYVYAGTYLQTNGNLIYPSGYGATQTLQVSNAANNAWIAGISIAPGGNVTVFNDLTANGNTYLGNANGDTVYVNDTIRIGATDSGDASLFFGEGSVAGSDYGVRWYWDSGYTFTWYTRNAGTDTALFDYVTNDTNYINWRRHFHMQNKEINYNAQIHFNAGTRFVGNNTSYLNFRSDSAGAGGILVQDGNATTKGYTGYWDSAGGGILNNTGNWAVRYNFGNTNSGGQLYGDWSAANFTATTFTGTLNGNANAVSFTEVELNAPVTVSGTWTTGNGSEWGEPKFGTSFNQFRYTDGNGPYVEYNIPANHHACFISQLQWDSGGYADCHGVQSDGDLVFLRRINTRQLVENSNHGNPIQHDGATVTFVGSGLQAFSKIRITNRSGRIHMTGIAFTRQVDDGYEGTGMLHPAQISHQGSGSGLDADLLDGYNSATANTANTIVLRDGSGNFSAGTITAALSGNATTATALTSMNISQFTNNSGYLTSAVTSLAGTTNRITVSGATGAVTLNLPQDIHTGASPTFAGLSLTSVSTTGATITNLTGAYQNTTVYDSPRTQSATPSRGIRAPASSIQFTDSYAIAPFYTYRSTGDWPVPYGIGWGTGGESSGIFQRYASNGSSFGDMIFYTGNDGYGAFSFRRHTWEGTTYFAQGSGELNTELFRIDWSGNLTMLGTLNGSANSATLYANNGSYGSWKIGGTRNGWYGIEFDSGVSLMVNSTEVGFHRNGSGWQMRWSVGTGYIHKGSNGGGTEATILDSSNYPTQVNGVLLRTASTPAYGDWNSFGNNTQTTNAITQEYFNVGIGSSTPNSNFPSVVAYRYGILTNLGSGADARAQIYISHAGDDLIFRGGWGTASWQTWNRCLTNINSPYAYNMNQYVRTTDTPTFAGVYTNLIGINDGGMDCYMEVTDANPTFNYEAYGGEFLFYGDKSRPSSLLYVGGIDVSRTIIANAISSRDYTRQLFPGGGYYHEGGSVTGAIKIRLPVNTKSVYPMLSFTCHIYNYSTGTSRTFKIGGHYSGATWYNPFAYCLSDNVGNLNVRWGYEGTYLCVWIGETNTGWSYPCVFITDFQNGYSAIDGIWMTGWSVTRVTAFDTVTNGPYSPGYFWNQNNDGAGSGLDADLLDGYNSATAGTANTIVLRDSSGHITGQYILGSYFNASAGNGENPTIGQIWTQNTTDNYLRKSTPAHFRSQVTDGSYPSLTGANASGTWSISVSGNAGTATSATSATSATFLNSSNYINRCGSSGNANTDFQNTPAGSVRHNGDDSSLTNSPGGTWWFYDNYRHSNNSNYWGIQVAWGWEDQANKLATKNITGGTFGGWVYYLNSSNAAMHIT